MTNVAKHSGASRCTLDIGLDGTLEVTVTDNGRGAPRPIGHGVGWTSMTDRASELGGSCTIASRVEGGLVVRAVLPLARGCRRAGDRVTRVLVADDHPAFRRGLELMLGGVDDVEIVGFAETGAKAVELAEDSPPTSSSWTCACPNWTASRPPGGSPGWTPAPAVVVLTMFEDDDSVFAAMRAGARGYLLKGADQDEIVRAVRAAAAGEAIFGPEIAARVIRHFASGSGSTAAAFPRSPSVSAKCSS